MHTPIAPLFVPAHKRKMLDGAIARDVDTVILDLEDAVPREEKDQAREGVRQFVRQRPGRAFARINPFKVTRGFGTACGAEDVAAVVLPGLRGLFLPKVETVEQLLEINDAIARCERAASIAEGSLQVGVIVETAQGIINLSSIARGRLGRDTILLFGIGDFTTDLEIDWSRDEAETLVPRSMVPIAARANELHRPLDSVFIDVADDEGLRASARQGKSLGYGGKCVIHPRQIEIVREVYRPTEAELAWSARIVEKAVEMQGQGSGAFLLDGRMIDDPIVERAKGVLARQADFQSGT